MRAMEVTELGRKNRPHGLVGEYFVGQGILNRVRKDRVEQIEYRGVRALGEGVTEQETKGYLIRWKGLVSAPHTERYTFYVTSLHGVCLWIDEVLVVDQWHKRYDETTTEVVVPLMAGRERTIRIEFTGPDQNLTAVLEWSSLSLGRETVPTDCLFPFVIWEGGDLPPVEPLFDYGIRDCQIMLGPDGVYYMTGTNGPDFWNDNDGIHIWLSTDLKEWTDIGLVWSLERDATWARRRSADGRRPLWAPELHYIKGTYWLTYSMGWWDGMCSGLLRSATGRVEGPYEEVTDGPIVNHIDATLFEDDDGQVYLIYANCLIARMNEDMTGFTEPFRQLIDSDGKPIGFEGAFMIKRNGKYHVVAAQTNDDYSLSSAYPDGLQSYDAMSASADDLYGPYGESHLALRHGGHSALFRDKQGDLWMSLFISGDNDNVPFQTRPAAVRMKFDREDRLVPLLSPRELVPTSLECAQQWRYKLDAPPAANWTLPEFDEGEWESGAGGFGAAGLPGSIVRTDWGAVSSDLWLRRTFQLEDLTNAEQDGLYLSIYCSVPTDVYLNGVLAATLANGTNYYRPTEIRREARAALATGGLHVLAVHARGVEGTGSVFADAGLTLWMPTGD